MTSTSQSALQVRPDAHRQGFAGVLVDDVGELESRTIGGLIELKVDGPHLVRPHRPQPVAAADMQAPALTAVLRPPQAFRPPQPLGSPAVHSPSSRRMMLWAVFHP
jgi:hypothetical protein